MAKPEKTTKAAAFRNELVKLMPGYRWTVNLSRSVWMPDSSWFTATGIQSSGSNRLSTLEVTRREEKGSVSSYEAQSSGYGVGARWLTDMPMCGDTLAQSIRCLQRYYEGQRDTYAGAASDLQGARQKKEDQGEQGQEETRPPGE